MRAKKHLYIEDDKCSHLSYYECCVNIFKNENFSNCSKTCIPTSLKSIGSISLAEIPTCYPETEDVCNVWDFFDEMFDGKCSQNCLKSCVIEEYQGRIDYEDLRTLDTSVFRLIFRYALPYKVLITQEYLIYDFIGMVGSVGGTLGMFVGFSFIDVVNRVANFFRYLCQSAS